MTMRVLYHHPVCPFSRMVRMVLIEKSLSFTLITEPFWERRPSFAAYNSAMEVPVLSEGGTHIADSLVIAEYLEETYPSPTLLGGSPSQRAEVRRIVQWFGLKFFREVSKYILYQRVVHYYTGNTEPSSDALRAAKINITTHLDYMAYLLNRNSWLAGDHVSLADMAASAQLSVLDYLGDVPWERHASVKEWYALMKSRPCFRPLLADRIVGFAPSAHYHNMDF